MRIEADEALAAAKAADDALARGQAKGPLHGVPLAHKDMYYSAGKPAGCGSKVREGWIAPATATAVARLEAAGSFRLGALHMAEFAYGPTGHNSYLGHALQSLGPERRITGGSSSGSGAAVAARLVPCGARLRHRRLDPVAGAFLRRDRLQADQRPRQPRQRHAAVVHARYGRAAGADAPRIAHWSLATIAGPDPLDPTTTGAPAWDATAAAALAEGA